jgi:hypothetical protein
MAPCAYLSLILLTSSYVAATIMDLPRGTRYVFALIFSEKTHRVQSKLGNVFGDFARDVKNDGELVGVAGATLYTR